MLFARVASKLGIEMVKVDTKILNPQLSAGQRLQGEIHFYGISTAQQINGVRLDLMIEAEALVSNGNGGTRYIYRDKCIYSQQYNQAFILPAYQNYILPFSLTLPDILPSNHGFGLAKNINIGIEKNYCSQTQIWLETYLDVDWHIDTKDRDDLIININPLLAFYIEVMKNCGLTFSHEIIKDNQKSLEICKLLKNDYYHLFTFYMQTSFWDNWQVDVIFNIRAYDTQILFKPERTQLKEIFTPKWVELVVNHDMDMQQLILQIKQLLKLS